MSSEPIGAPRSTYRLQLGPELGFDQVAELAEYLSALGVSHVYLSPILTATPGSTHGYDVTEHGRISDELGGGEAFEAMATALADHGVGVVVDIVPNHMAVPTPEALNPALWSVLREGRSSPYAKWFDIDWTADDGRLALPVLGAPLEDSMGDLRIDRRRTGPVALAYHDHRFPLAAGTSRLGMKELVAAQHYRLADWHDTAAVLNYRRFMDITSLICLRVEDREVFDATHRVLLEQVHAGRVQGLRVDHVDGLADPAGYLATLAAASDRAWVVVEKIVSDDERVPPDWATAGTTGYDALTLVNSLFVDPRGEQPLGATYAELTGAPADFAQVADDAKRLVADQTFRPELQRLARLLAASSAAGTSDDLQAAIVELICGLDVYRPYTSSARTVAALDAATQRAVAAAPGHAAQIAAVRAHALDGSEFATRFGQTAAAVFAKGVEDTAFYRHARLLSLNEVGGDPGRFGASIAEFHDFAATQQAEHPTAMTTLSTHDTKRSEDVRARLAVLSELPAGWDAAVRRWLAAGEELGCPDTHTGYFFWQTLVGAWPLDAERAIRYMEKAMREAKQHTSWHAPDDDYEERMRGFIANALADERLTADVETFVDRLEPFARANSLGQKLVQLTMPGVPDVYQGCESSSFRLVDPDNREPVDFARRREAVDLLLDEKLRVTATALRLAPRPPRLVRRVRGAAADWPGVRPSRRVRPLGPTHHPGHPALRSTPARRRVAVDQRAAASRHLGRHDQRGRGGGRRTAGRRVAVARAGRIVRPGSDRHMSDSPASRRPGVWAPDARAVDLVLDGASRPLRRDRDGWWRSDDNVPPDRDYGFRLDGGPVLADPRAQRQPHGVHGLSQVVDHDAYDWRAPWPGRELCGGIIYELHVGTFTPDGTFDAAAEHLDHLVDLGVDFVELMPVAAFPGRHGWGYDGVFPFAVHEPYGGPDGLKRLVDACHARGLGVVLDVVYNHLGPDANVLPAYGPYFTDTYSTPWGAAVNFGGAGSDEVRRYVIDNALMWLRDYRFDALRLDAVHAIFDASARHILEELGAAVRELARSVGRPLALIAESDQNDPRLLTDTAHGGYQLDAQWSDDFHHAVHAALTGENHGYYSDFGSLDDVARALRHGFVYTGQHSAYRNRRHGRALPPSIAAHRLLGYSQTHDQVGNRARGERLAALVSPGLAKVAAALALTSPFTPMLFMGEEWAASTPWQYFTDHEDPQLAEAVRQGRRREFAAFGWQADEVPDPQDVATVQRSTLRWNEIERKPHADMLRWYRDLIALRRNSPDLRDPDFGSVVVDADDATRVLVMTRGSTSVVANVDPEPRLVDVKASEVLLASAPVELRGGRLELPGESVAVVRA